MVNTTQTEMNEHARTSMTAVHDELHGAWAASQAATLTVIENTSAVMGIEITTPEEGPAKAKSTTVSMTLVREQITAAIFKPSIINKLKEQLDREVEHTEIDLFINEIAEAMRKFVSKDRRVMIQRTLDTTHSLKQETNNLLQRVSTPIQPYQAGEGLQVEGGNGPASMAFANVVEAAITAAGAINELGAEIGDDSETQPSKIARELFECTDQVVAAAARRMQETQDTIDYARDEIKTQAAKFKVEYKKTYPLAKPAEINMAWYKADDKLKSFTGLLLDLRQFTC